MTSGDDHEIAVWLNNNGYADIEDWAIDNDYYYSDVSCEWYCAQDHGPFAEPHDLETDLRNEILNERK